MTSKLWTLLACFGLSGCAVFSSTSPSELANPDFPPTITPSEVAAFPAGARVEMTHDRDNRYEKFAGTVLHASPQGVALLNCEHSARSVRGVPVLNKTPFLNRLFKNTGVGVQRVPVQWVSIHQVTSAKVISPPPADYVAPQLAIDTNDELYFERIGIESPPRTDTAGP